jgi:hypothetical protein
VTAMPTSAEHSEDTTATRRGESALAAESGRLLAAVAVGVVVVAAVLVAMGADRPLYADAIRGRDLAGAVRIVSHAVRPMIQWGVLLTAAALSLVLVVHVYNLARDEIG